MKSVQIFAKTVQKAIELGLEQLKATQEEVDIKILDEGGLFRKAKVEIILDKEEDIVEKSQKEETKTVEEKVQEDKKETKITEENKIEIVKEDNKEAEKDNLKIERNDIKYFIERGKNFLKELFLKMKIEAEISVVETEDSLSFNAEGENVGNLIGKRGETLNAIQEIISNVLKNIGFKQKRVYFDVENYRNRREMSLIGLAERMASKAVKIGKPIKLEHMSAYERKIVHNVIQDIDGVSSKSEGVEPYRFLIITPDKKN